VRPISPTLVSLVAGVTIAVHAGNQSAELQYSVSANSVFTSSLEPTPNASTLPEHFKAAFDRSAADLFEDQLHPFRGMNWNLMLANSDSERLREQSTGAGYRALSKSVVYGLREATVDLPILLWLEDRQEFLADFLRNSVDDVGEEAVEPFDLSSGVIERSWWNRLRNNGHVHYGIRPFRTDPYAFLSTAIKHGDTVLLLAHLRYRYSHFSDHKCEFALSAPLAHRCLIDLGTSYQFGRQNQAERLVLKLVKELKSGGVLHVGFEVQERPVLIAGLTIPW